MFFCLIRRVACIASSVDACLLLEEKETKIKDLLWVKKLQKHEPDVTMRQASTKIHRALGRQHEELSHALTLN